MQEDPAQAETHTLRGATDRPALLTIRNVVEKMEPLATAELDTYLNPSVLEVALGKTSTRGRLHSRQRARTLSSAARCEFRSRRGRSVLYHAVPRRVGHPRCPQTLAGRLSYRLVRATKRREQPAVDSTMAVSSLRSGLTRLGQVTSSRNRISNSIALQGPSALASGGYLRHCG
jgi:hypothetical protein